MDETRETLLRVEDLSVSFAGKNFVQAVEHVSLEVRAGDRLCIIGETGSGKSILLLAILRLLSPTAMVTGAVSYRDKDLFSLTDRQLDAIRGRCISYVPQGSGNGMNPLLKVGFPVAEPLIAHRGMKRRPAEMKAVELLRRFHLGREETIARQYPFTYSGGMRQRALIAMGISAGAELLFADEPTKGLDETRVQLTVEAFNALEGQTLVCVTHDLSFARRVSSRVCVMYAANQVEAAQTEELFVNPLHPYTRDMLAAMPENGLHFRPGYAPAHNDAGTAGCKYRLRCDKCSDKCKETPPMFDVGGHQVRCWQYE
jgi:peptide/nickel transport system ATP-binding protein